MLPACMIQHKYIIDIPSKQCGNDEAKITEIHMQDTRSRLQIACIYMSRGIDRQRRRGMPRSSWACSTLTTATANKGFSVQYPTVTEALAYSFFSLGGEINLMTYSDWCEDAIGVLQNPHASPHYINAQGVSHKFYENPCRVSLLLTPFTIFENHQTFRMRRSTGKKTTAAVGEESMYAR